MKVIKMVNSENQALWGIVKDLSKFNPKRQLKEGMIAILKYLTGFQKEGMDFLFIAPEG